MIQRITFLMFIALFLRTSVTISAAQSDWLKEKTQVAVDSIKNGVDDLACYANLGCQPARELASGALSTVGAISDRAEQLMDELEKKYQGNLDFTLDQLDPFIRNQMFEVHRLIEETNGLLNDTISSIDVVLEDRITQISEETNEIVLSVSNELKSIIVFAFQGSLIVANQLTLLIVLVISISLLGIGWIFFSRALIIHDGQLNPLRVAGLIIMLLFSAVFATLAFVPAARNNLIASTGLGVRQAIEYSLGEPIVTKLQPNALNLKTHSSLQVHGSYLLDEGTPPVVTINGQELEIIEEPENYRLVFDITGLEFGENVEEIVHLHYPDERLNVEIPILINEVVEPPTNFAVVLRLTYLGLVQLTDEKLRREFSNGYYCGELRLLGGGAVSFVDCNYFGEFNGLTQIVIRDPVESIIPIRISFETIVTKTIVEVAEFDLNWVDLRDCRGDGTCRFTQEKLNIPFLTEQVGFSGNYCMKVIEYIDNETFKPGDACTPEG